MKSCAIVILNYNGEKVLSTFLPSVIAFSVYDIWVIDNASTDSSLEFLEVNYPQVSLIKLKANFGFTGGYNWGLEELRGKYSYFILLNSDVEVTQGWDSKLIGFLNKNTDYAAVQPKILSWKDKSLFDYAGAGGGFLDAFAYPYCRGRMWDILERDQGQYNDSIPVDWASGACMAIDANDFFDQEGFDGHFFAHMEEIDLCWRLRRARRKIGYLGEVTVYHQGGATLDRGSGKKLYLNIRNSLSMIFKNTSLARFLWVFLVKLFLESLASVGYLLSGKYDFAAAVWKGYFDFFKSIGLRYAQKSLEVQVPIGSGPCNLLFFNVKVLGKRKFSDL
ncbi:glycosyltransferase family 2 protein [Algoriphagus aquatilis]|uniref:Glycosyltransferase family 2 protein n=1 Tax=Algoriphagus aquatilis TaxID=490186 RepID=A0ABW0BXA9_9BACT|nr:glycosyltransferase family 2 protein [Algoriphagus sp.]